MGNDSVELLSLVESFGYDLFSIGTFGVKSLKSDKNIHFANILVKARF